MDARTKHDSDFRRPRRAFYYCSMYLTFVSPVLRFPRIATRSCATKQITKCSSLEDSKKRSKSPYDNIPDLNQQYLAELGWVERKYGPKGLNKKDVLREAQGSILRPDGPISNPVDTPENDVMNTNKPSDLSSYAQLRNRLLGDTITVAILGASAFWSFGTIRLTASFGVGALGSIAFVVLLSRSVDRLAEAARTAGTAAGDPLQPARVGIIVFLVLAAAKNRQSLDVLPVIFGFFSYKIASLLPLLTGEAFD